MPKPGEALRAWRNSKKWSARELAEKVDCHLNTIYRLETGLKGYSRTSQQKFADAFGCTTSELLDYPPVGPEVMALLTDEQQQAIYRMVWAFVSAQQPPEPAEN